MSLLAGVGVWWALRSTQTGTVDEDWRRIGRLQGLDRLEVGFKAAVEQYQTRLCGWCSDLGGQWLAKRERERERQCGCDCVVEAWSVVCS